MALVALVSASCAFVAPGNFAAPTRSTSIAMAGNVKDIPVKNVWTAFVSAADVPDGEIASGFRFGQEIAIANSGGKLYALSNKLPPTGQPATLAKIEKLKGENVIVEPLSGCCFSLKSGKPVGPWCPTLVGKLLGLLVAPQDVPVYQVRKSGKSVEVLIDVNLKAKFEAQYWRGVLDAQGKVDGGYY